MGTLPQHSKNAHRQRTGIRDSQDKQILGSLRTQPFGIDHRSVECGAFHPAMPLKCTVRTRAQRGKRAPAIRRTRPVEGIGNVCRIDTNRIQLLTHFPIPTHPREQIHGGSWARIGIEQSFGVLTKSIKRSEPVECRVGFIHDRE